MYFAGMRRSTVVGLKLEMGEAYMEQIYGKWPERSDSFTAANWKNAARITAGVDVGTTSTQAAIFCDDMLYSYSSIRTGASFGAAADAALSKALQAGGLSMEAVQGHVVATGWGARHVSMACKTMDEIHCHAMGARFMFGKEVHTVVDLGGQTIKAIRLYDWNRVRDFMINDKCATGMGRGLETLCELLQVPITEIGALSLEVKADPEPVSTTCAAFAATETLGLFGRPEFKSAPLTPNEVYASHLFAIAWRILGVIGKLQSLEVGDITAEPALAFTGGLAKNIGITSRIARELKLTALTSPYDPQLAGAIGAALLA